MRNRSSRELIAWAIAGVVVAAGIVTVIVGLATPVSYWWSAFQPTADDTFTPADGSILVTRTAVIGIIIIGIGLVALAFLAGWNLAKRRTS